MRSASRNAKYVLLTIPFSLRLLSVFDRLVNRDEADGLPDSATPDSASALARGGEELVNSSDNGSKPGQRGLPRLLVSLGLHSADLELLLERAPSAAVREAWKTGQPVHGQFCRIILAESRLTRPWWVSTGIRSRKVYEEGRARWEEHGGGEAR